jgi:hypothetical protein
MSSRVSLKRLAPRSSLSKRLMATAPNAALPGLMVNMAISPLPFSCHVRTAGNPRAGRRVQVCGGLHRASTRSLAHGGTQPR